MISFNDWQIVENVEIVAMGGESFDFDNDTIDQSDATEQAWAIAKASPIRILSDKELAAVATLDGQVIGAMFNGWSQEEYTFDVVVDPKFQQQGIGKKLIDYAMSAFNWDSDGRGDKKTPAYIKAEVVNKNLIPLLTRMGFKPKGVYGGITVMYYGNPRKRR